VGTTAADSARLVTTGVTANLITARARARHMIEQGAGVIPASDGGSACGCPIMGSTDPADAATDTSIRNPAAELGPHGVHVLSIWTVRLPEALSPGRLAEVDCKHQDEAAFEGLTENLDRIRMTRRSPRLAEVAATATFLAFDKAGAITGAFVNVTSGAFPNYMALASRTTERQGEAA
jgi:enoyl-[acyl-carrier-protein] reductase (NADH)